MTCIVWTITASSFLVTIFDSLSIVASTFNNKNLEKAWESNSNLMNSPFVFNPIWCSYLNGNVSFDGKSLDCCFIAHSQIVTFLFWNHNLTKIATKWTRTVTFEGILNGKCLQIFSFWTLSNSQSAKVWHIHAQKTF